MALNTIKQTNYLYEKLSYLHVVVQIIDIVTEHRFIYSRLQKEYVFDLYNIYMVSETVRCHHGLVDFKVH